MLKNWWLFLKLLVFSLYNFKKKKKKRKERGIKAGRTEKMMEKKCEIISNVPGLCFVTNPVL